jgi:hypothetical protein
LEILATRPTPFHSLGLWPARHQLLRSRRIWRTI